MSIRHSRSLKRSALASALSSALILSGAALAQEAPQESPETPQARPTAQQEATALDTVVVTARKRSESIMEVPMNITAISAEELTSRNLTSVGEIYRTIAGGASATGQLILRGLSGSNSPSPGTTSQFVDGIPFGSSNIFDVERVEILRGPQGTLWGSNAIGGTVQIVTNKPRTDRFELFGSLRASSENDVSGLARRIEAGINAPLIQDTLALRVVGSTYETPARSSMQPPAPGTAPAANCCGCSCSGSPAKTRVSIWVTSTSIRAAKAPVSRTVLVLAATMRPALLRTPTHRGATMSTTTWSHAIRPGSARPASPAATRA
nr:TonB-dependent receptor plug domain-containing protein [Lysobacter alkalisoli]